MEELFRIRKKLIGGKRVFIIAEAGVNHNGNLELAKELVYQAKKSGADAVKFQSFRADYMCLRSLKEKKDIKSLTKGSDSAYDMYKALELSLDSHIELIRLAKKEKIIFMSSVFDLEMVGILKKFGVDALKIASGDITFKPLIESAVKTKLPVFLSSGMSDEKEISRAVLWAKKAGAKKFALLHCVSLYPPNFEELNLNFIRTLNKKYSFPIGYSDHTKGYEACIAAVALGAKIIEKHFTLEGNLKGPDHAISLNPKQFSEMVEKIRNIENSLGSEKKVLSRRELKERKSGRRGLKASIDINKGDIITNENSVFIKPENGVKPFEAKKVFGKRAAKRIPKGSPIHLRDVK